jgi:hypothetical protein
VDKIFLIDVDGVVFDFLRTFEQWVKHHKFQTISPHLAEGSKYHKLEEWLNISFDEAEALIGDFFESEYSKHFITFPDAIDVITELKNSGWTFVAITAIGQSQTAINHRKIALENALGKYVVSDVLTVGPLDSKRHQLEKFKPTLWVDDTPKHAQMGSLTGHYSFRLKRPMDARHTIEHENLIEVNDWFDIRNWMKENMKLDGN